MVRGCTIPREGNLSRRSRTGRRGHRRRWRVRQCSMVPAAVASLDETGEMRPSVLRLETVGLAPCSRTPHGHAHPTFVVGLRPAGSSRPSCGRPDDGEPRFASRPCRSPAELELGEVVVMDNLSAHKVAGVQEAIRALGASVLYLPSSADSEPDRERVSREPLRTGLLLTPRVYSARCCLRSGLRGAMTLKQRPLRWTDLPIVSTPTSGGADQHAYPRAPVRRSGGLP